MSKKLAFVKISLAHFVALSPSQCSSNLYGGRFGLSCKFYLPCLFLLHSIMVLKNTNVISSTCGDIMKCRRSSLFMVLNYIYKINIINIFKKLKRILLDHFFLGIFYFYLIMRQKKKFIIKIQGKHLHKTKWLMISYLRISIIISKYCALCRLFQSILALTFATFYGFGGDWGSPLRIVRYYYCIFKLGRHLV